MCAASKNIKFSLNKTNKVLQKCTATEMLHFAATETNVDVATFWLTMKPSLNVSRETHRLSASVSQCGCAVLPRALAAYDFVWVEGIFGAASKGPLTSIFSSWADLGALPRPSVQLDRKPGRRLFLDSMTRHC